MAKTATACALLVTVVGLVGCGGSSGDGGNGNQLGGGADLVTIDSQSAPVIAAAVADAVVSSQDMSVIGGFAVPTAGVGLASLGKDAPQMLAAAYGPETVPCDAGGSLTLSGTVAVPDSVTVGDTVSFEFTDCDDGNGVVVDGRAAFEIVAFSGDVAMGMLTLTVSMTLESLQYIEDGVGGSMDGDLSFTIDTTNMESFVAVSSTLITLAHGSVSTTLKNYIMTMTADPTLGTVTLDSSATVNRSDLSGEFSYVTSTSLVFSGGAGPESGQIEVTGAGGGTMTISILGAEQIELEIDADGNGTIDEVIVTTWAELTA